MRRYIFFLFILLMTGFSFQVAHAEDFNAYCNIQANALCPRSICTRYGIDDIDCNDYVTACADQEAEDCLRECQNSPDSCIEQGETLLPEEPNESPTAPSQTMQSTTTTEAVSPATITLTNPLGIEDPREFIARLIQAVISISGAIALIMFIYAGLLFLTSGGNSDQVQKAKLLMLYVILGIIVIAGAFVATNTIFTAVLTGNPVVGG